jgi:hypothetical protein
LNFFTNCGSSGGMQLKESVLVLVNEIWCVFTCHFSCLHRKHDQMEISLTKWAHSFKNCLWMLSSYSNRF